VHQIAADFGRPRSGQALLDIIERVWSDYDGLKRIEALIALEYVVTDCQANGMLTADQAKPFKDEIQPKNIAAWVALIREEYTAHILISDNKKGGPVLPDARN
jgi:hypothetical protein